MYCLRQWQPIKTWLEVGEGLRRQNYIIYPSKSASCNIQRIFELWYTSVMNHPWLWGQPIVAANDISHTQQVEGTTMTMWLVKMLPTNPTRNHRIVADHCHRIWQKQPGTTGLRRLTLPTLHSRWMCSHQRCYRTSSSRPMWPKWTLLATSLRAQSSSW